MRRITTVAIAGEPTPRRPGLRSYSLSHAHPIGTAQTAQSRSRHKIQTLIEHCRKALDIDRFGNARPRGRGGDACLSPFLATELHRHFTSLVTGKRWIDRDRERQRVVKVTTS